MNNMNELNKPQKATYFNYKVSLLEAFLFFLITLSVGQVLGGIISIPTLMNPTLSHVLLPLSFLFGFGASALTIMFIKKLDKSELKHFFHIKVRFIHIVLAIILYVVALPIAEFLAMLVPTEGHPVLEGLHKWFQKSFEMILDYKIAAFIMVCILAPILEELIFRGLILRGLLNKGNNPWFSIILTAFLFGAAHMNPWQFMGAGFLGVIFGYIYWRTQSLILCILLHFLNNLIAFTVSMYYGDMEETVFEPDYLVIGGSIVATIIMGYILLKSTKNTALKAVE